MKSLSFPQCTTIIKLSILILFLETAVSPLAAITVVISVAAEHSGLYAIKPHSIYLLSVYLTAQYSPPV